MASASFPRLMELKVLMILSVKGLGFRGLGCRGLWCRGLEFRV